MESKANPVGFYVKRLPIVNPFWQNIFRNRGHENTLNYFLSTIPIFSKLEKRELTLMENTIHIRNYAPDEIVFNEGDIGSGMYLIRSGKVQIYKLDSLGQERELASLEAGDFFGEVALTTSRPRNAAARTTEATVLIGLFRSDFLDTVRRHPIPAAKILIGLNRVISDRLMQCSDQLDELNQRYGSQLEQHKHE